MCYELQNADDIQKFEGVGNLDLVLEEGYEKWLEQNQLDKHIEDINPNWSNSTKYVLIDEKGHVYGSCSLRYYLKGKLLNIGGNISYEIRPSERGKGYGLIQLNLILEKYLR